MSSGTFIVIEALDGVGKTTLVRELAARLGGIALDTPGSSLRRMSSAILEALGPNQSARCLFYAASVLAQGRRARELADSGTAVVMDRYWGSTVAYARARGATIELESVQSLVPQPDVTILLTLDERERVRRLESRGALTPADAETLSEDFRVRVLSELRRFATAEVDLTGATPAEAVDRVLEALGTETRHATGPHLPLRHPSPLPVSYDPRRTR